MAVYIDCAAAEAIDCAAAEANDCAAAEAKAKTKKADAPPTPQKPKGRTKPPTS
jgi:hypothetical protein